jgi:hypothetical protein
MNRARHLPTVWIVTPSVSATAVLLSPSAQRRMIRARCAVACALFRRATKASRCALSASFKLNSAFGRPRIIIVTPIVRSRRDLGVNLYCSNLPDRTLEINSIVAMWDAPSCEGTKVSRLRAKAELSLRSIAAN